LSTGGLGGTGSDLSKQAASIATSIPLETDPDIYKYLMDRHVPERISRSFAAIPAGSTVFQNTSGVAPGIVIHTNGKYLILLPGPPEEIKSIIRNGLEAFLKTFGNGYTKNDVLKIVGLRESEVEDRIHDLALSSNPTISTFLKKGWIEISLTAKGKDENEAIAILEEVKKRVLERFPEKFLGKVGETLEEELYRLLKEKNLTLSVAESVTGGMISDRIVSVPGISSFFKGGVVVYSNESKIKILGVSKKTITEHGAVSKACVLEMAKGALEVFKTDIAIATTGLAGPTGETKDNPLGTVWFGLSSKFESQVWQKIYGGTRNEVRKAASDDALESLVNMIANFEVIENG
jgi:nicotinamide-nucleotide amidase